MCLLLVSSHVQLGACSLLVLYGIKDKWLLYMERIYYRRHYARKPGYISCMPSCCPSPRTGHCPPSYRRTAAPCCTPGRPTGRPPLSVRHSPDLVVPGNISASVGRICQDFLGFDARIGYLGGNMLRMLLDKWAQYTENPEYLLSTIYASYVDKPRAQRQRKPPGCNYN